MENPEEIYADIINLQHHVSQKYPHMKLEERAAQFAPFAALTGYDAQVKETARITNKWIELDEEQKTILDGKLQIILAQLDVKPVINITYFVPDLKKEGGEYLNITGIIKKIDEYNQVIVFENNKEIPISNVIDIKGNTLNNYDVF